MGTIETYVEFCRELFPDLLGDLLRREEKVKLGVGGEKHYEKWSSSVDCLDAEEKRREV